MSSNTNGSTWTSEGCIPHLKITEGDLTFFAPVKMATQPGARGGLMVVYAGRNDLQYPQPMRRDGRLVFALPAGGEALG